MSASGQAYCRSAPVARAHSRGTARTALAVSCNAKRRCQIRTRLAQLSEPPRRESGVKKTNWRLPVNWPGASSEVHGLPGQGWLGFRVIRTLLPSQRQVGKVTPGSSSTSPFRLLLPESGDGVRAPRHPNKHAGCHNNSNPSRPTCLLTSSRKFQSTGCSTLNRALNQNEIPLPVPQQFPFPASMQRFVVSRARQFSFRQSRIVQWQFGWQTWVFHTAAPICGTEPISVSGSQ